MITLIGKRQAKEGAHFIYLGPLSECKECRLRGVCLNMEQGALYEVTRLRDVTHDCDVHDEGVCVVEVEKKPRKITVPMKVALEGGTITYDEPKCECVGCQNHRFCHPLGLRPGSKITITSLGKDVTC
ncbi:MAG TPA: UPF0179 family protein, partial [Candidatus Methanomethylophilaceae archaeon]|nr:UPF0179 family protein [Candidatus Methanomethylophilaceae archaeon]